MAYKISKIKKGRCFRVRNTTTGQLKARCTTKKKATTQVKILKALEK